MRRRGWLTALAVVVLGLVTAAVVVLALRPVEAPVTTSVSLETGAVAASEDSVWRWVGPPDCGDDADAVPVERSEAGSPWRPSPVPLANVDGLSFGSPSSGIATGTTSQCSRGVALTSDGGATWTYHEDNPVLLDAWYVGDRVWGVERVIGESRISVYRVDEQLRLRPVPGTNPTQPCRAGDGGPTHVSFWDDTTGLVLCQNAVVGARLLARTTNAGESFERLTDDRPELGFDGPEPVLDLDVVGTTTVTALFGPGAECREGQLRTSTSGGASFRRMPCPSDSVEVDTALDVAFTSPRDAVLLGLRDRQPVLLASSDGGKTWSES